MGLNAEQIETAVASVAERDAHVRDGLRAVGLPEPRIGEPGFPSLLRVMVAQQLSVKAAATIWARLEALLADVTPETLLAHSDDALRGAGLSRQKAAYARTLAEASASGALDFAAIAGLSDEDAVAEISAVKGFGRWSAEIYLMFCEGRPDLMPAADLGLQAGLQRLKGLETRPTAKDMPALVEPWRPHRSAMALFLWHYYAKTAAPVG